MAERQPTGHKSTGHKSTGHKASGHIANLDALRAVSVILVMAFHARYLAVGWIGVWIFFALSGFLITRSLIGLQSETFSRGLGIFYARRSLRIFPVYFLYVTVFVLGFAIAGQALSTADTLFLYTYTTNLAPLFGEAVTGRAFAHLWSLGVEEQYYLLVAPIMLLLAARSNILLFAAMMVVVPALRWWAFQSMPADPLHAASVVKGVTIFQMDSFMIGGLLAFGEARILKARPATFLAAALPILIVSAAFLGWNYGFLREAGLIVPSSPALAYSAIPQWRLSPTSLGLGIEPHENGAYVWLYTLLALNSALAIAAIIRFGQHLRLGVANRIGRVSYGMYVYHSVLVAALDAALRMAGIGKYSALGFAGFVGLVLTTWLIAEASFAWIERPFLLRKDRVGKTRKAEAASVLGPAE